MFKTARLKLTAWYVLIIMIISASFSLLIYQLVNNEITRFASSQRNRIERQYVIQNPNLPPQSIIVADQDLINESRGRLKLNLLFINGIIIIISGSLSYFLAGLTLKPIQKMSEDQKRFISDASHELRTPITALKSLFEVTLRDKKLDLKEAKKAIKSGIDQSDRLNNLSNSILELSRLETNHIETQFNPLSLKKIISESITQIIPQANLKKINITSKLVDSKIFGDQNRLVELFTIFLDNAIKYSPNNTQIKIFSKIVGKNNQIKIIDHGIGIDQKDLPYIFDRFYQADNSRSKNDKSGYGLGLSIAKKIIYSHNGSIKVSSQVGVGTKFIIYLPLFS
jgi:two-component system, OmpR family, sensor histidine kinase CiaH